jgi:prolyl 4-hydroxylase
LIRDDLPGKGVRGKGRGRLYNRVASFFIYLEDECVGGGTEFPDLKLDDSMIFAGTDGAAEESSASQHISSILKGKRGEASRTLGFWKERVEIDNKEQKSSQPTRGTTFKPRKGSGIFWVNLHASGFGDQRVKHAGLPVQEGQKVGMNVWVKRDFGW